LLGHKGGTHLRQTSFSLFSVRTQVKPN